MISIPRRSLMAGAALLLGSRWALAAPPTFVLEDQWERTFDQSAVFRAKVVLLGGDQRRTGDRIGEWAKQLDGLFVYGIADLRALPFFVPKSSVRSNLTQVAPKTSVLLDWKGSVYAPLLGFPKDQEIVVQVHGVDGAVLSRVVGSVTNDRVAAVRKAVTG